MKLFSLLMALLLIGGCSTQQQQRMQGDASMQEVQQSITRMIYGVDTKDWSQAQAEMTNTVMVDYSDLTGQPASQVKASDLINGWKALLQPVNTHHQLSNFDIEIQGDHADAYSYVYASHTYEGVEYWDVFGIYHHQLIRTAEGWKINKIKLIVHGQKGNPNFFQDVSQKLTTQAQP